MSGWLYRIPVPRILKRSSNLPIDAWLRDTLGPLDYGKSAGTWRWTIANGIGDDKCDWVCLRSKADYTLFLMAWKGKLDEQE